MKQILYSNLNIQIHDIRTQLLKKRSNLSLLFAEDFESIYLYPQFNMAKYHTYSTKRKHLIIGQYGHSVPSFDELMKACIKTLDTNGVIILWDT